MDRFLIAENPMSGNIHTVVIQTTNPVSIIECISGIESFTNKLHKHFEFKNSYGLTEHWTLRVHHVSLAEIGSENHRKETEKILERAWRWYRSFLEWKLKNVK